MRKYLVIIVLYWNSSFFISWLPFADQQDEEQEYEGDPHLQVAFPTTPKRQRKESVFLDEAQDEDVVAWYRANRCLYDSSHKLHKEAAPRLAMYQAKAVSLGILRKCTWFFS